jgi:hypothetical protein
MGYFESVAPSLKGVLNNRWEGIIKIPGIGFGPRLGDGWDEIEG